jgi:phosphoribosyl 1,2-cyclic phosphodiesterase
MRFCTLASGSSGNASLLMAGGFGVLLDLGLGPRTLAWRLAEVGASWDDIDVALLTHVHGDHWNERTLKHLYRRGIPLYCHRSHAGALKYESRACAELLEDERLCYYEVDRPIVLTDGIACRPLALRHDAYTTCGFRFDGGPDLLGQTWALAYAADLGSWDLALAEAFADVDVLALEFNHDVDMELGSGRSAALIDRVLGNHGHLSNEQATDLLAEVLRRSAGARLQHVVQLHLSQQCNRPALARQAARRIIDGLNHKVRLHTAEQYASGSWLALRRMPASSGKVTRKQMAVVGEQLWLPGWEA